jgi:Protein of unknown function (DUF2938)
MTTDFLLRALFMGVCATALLDVWAFVLNRLFGFGLPNWGLIGRWLGHMPAGRFTHDSIADSPSIENEKLAGWIFHYAVGVLFAAVTLALVGPAWVKSPTLFMPMLVGLVTVGCGWFVLQPALGAGMASSRKPDASRIRLLNIVGHTVFGFGLWFAAMAIRGL